MASKGVDYYTYMTGSQFSVNITAPAINNTYYQSNNFVHQNLQIDSSNIPGWNDTGMLTWLANLNGTPVGSGNEEINSLTGQLEGGTMSVMMSTPSTFGSSYGLSYGFYDAGSGIRTSLTNQDQLYVYLTDNYSTWMGDLINVYPAAKSIPFQQFALPGAHDAGMFDLDTVNNILSSPYAQALLAALTFIPVIGPIIAGLGTILIRQAPRVITNIAMTQKDNITTMLNLGIRYFDFPAGTLYPTISAYNPGVRYHQHWVIPGYPYISFLQDVLTWLSQHPKEIVVVSANTQGFPKDKFMEPSPQDLLNDLATAFTNTNLTGKIGTGDKSSLGQTYAQLLESNTRLIFLNQISSPPETTKYDSYNDAYATATPSPIIAAFNGMNKQDQVGHDYTVLQMQGTTTAMGKSVIAPAFATLSDASSPLMSTKASFDIATNPWLLANVSNSLSNSQLVVFLNDFADNCMVSTAIAVTKQRMSTHLYTTVYATGADPGASGIGGYDLSAPADQVFAFDYDGSGKLDHLVLYRPGTGTIWILKNSGGSFAPVYRQGSPGGGIGGYDLSAPADQVFAFDYDGSGKLDHLVLYRPGTGTIWILKNSDGSFAPVYRQGSPGGRIGGYDLSAPADQVFAFDYDGSGKLDYLVLYRPGTGTIWILKNSGGSFAPVYRQGSPGGGIGGYDLSAPADQVFAFDYDGSGKLDHLVLYRPGTGTIWILKNSDGSFAPVYRQGSPGGGIGGYDLSAPVDQVFAFDYDGSGKLDHLVLYRPGTSTIWILKNSDGSFAPVYRQGSPGGGIGGYDLSAPADRVFAFDYDGSDKLDHLVLYRPGAGTIWILRRY